MTDRTAGQRDDPVEQLRTRVRAAFDGEDVSRKNIALRIAWDALRKLRDERDEARAALARSEAERERLREALREIERLYWIEAKGGTWRASHMKAVAEALLDELGDTGRAALREEQGNG